MVITNFLFDTFSLGEFQPQLEALEGGPHDEVLYIVYPMLDKIYADKKLEMQKTFCVGVLLGMAMMGAMWVLVAA